jgi:CDP-glycerol glycerophosphotransferase (TagB/SpsB family)
MNQLEYFLFVEFLRRKNKKLNKIYHSLCVEPNLSKKYIYFAANYQPEAITLTNGGVYDDLFLVLDIISNIIPEDWIIYYKEHPYTFKDPLGKGNLRRNKNYFQRIKAYKNIKLVSPDINSFELIDCSQAVVSVSGTVAWEAVVRGKPAMSFGSAWYMGCKSIFSIENLQEAKDAIEKIMNGWTPEQSDVERYAAAVEKVAVKDVGSWYSRKIYFSPHSKEIENPDERKRKMEHFGKVLHESYEKFYKNRKINL